MVIRTSTSKPTAQQWPALVPLGALAGKPPIPLARAATLVGSRQTANLRLHSSQVSKAHALILSSQGTVHIRDLNSRTKVFINNKVVREADLKEGDQVKIGRYTFKFTAGPKLQSTARKRQVPAGQLETDAGDVVPLKQRVAVIGQRQGSDLVVPSESVSTTHAAIFDVNGRRYIMDLGSRSGTLVNNQKTLQVELKIGDVIDIGGTEVRYTAASGAGVAAPASRPMRAAPAAAAAQVDAPSSADADIDELLALESLADPEPAASAPRGNRESKIFEPEPEAIDDPDATLALEDAPSLPPPMEPEDEVEAVAEVEEVAQKPSDDLAAEKAAEDELMALLEPEKIEEPAAEVEAVVATVVEEEAAIRVEEQREEVEQELLPLEIENKPMGVEEVEPIDEVAPAPEAEPEIAIVPEVEVVEERPLTATTNVDLIPDAIDEVTREMESASEAFPTAELPPMEAVEAAGAQELELDDLLADVEPVEESRVEEKIEEVIAVGETPAPEVVMEPEAQAEVELEQSISEETVEEHAREYEGMAPALEVVAEPEQSPQAEPEAEEADIEAFLAEEPAPVVDEMPEPAPALVVDEIPEPAPAPIVDEIPEPAPAPVVDEISELEPAPVVDEIPAPPPMPVAPAAPKWVAAPIDDTKQAPPTILTVRPNVPVNFTLDDLLGTTPTVASVAPPIPVTPPPPPVIEEPEISL